MLYGLFLSDYERQGKIIHIRVIAIYEIFTVFAAFKHRREHDFIATICAGKNALCRKPRDLRAAIGTVKGLFLSLVPLFKGSLIKSIKQIVQAACSLYHLIRRPHVFHGGFTHTHMSEFDQSVNKRNRTMPENHIQRIPIVSRGPGRKTSAIRTDEALRLLVKI